MTRGRTPVAKSEVWSAILLIVILLASMIDWVG